MQTGEEAKYRMAVAEYEYESYYTVFGGMFIIDRKIIYDYGYRLQQIESGVIINDIVRNCFQTDYCCSGLRSTIP